MFAKTTYSMTIVSEDNNHGTIGGGTINGTGIIYGGGYPFDVSPGDSIGLLLNPVGRYEFDTIIDDRGNYIEAENIGGLSAQFYAPEYTKSVVLTVHWARKNTSGGGA